MDAAQFEALVQRLIADPYDADARAYAHEAGQRDPTTYATLLERVGAGASDMETAAHWFNEAATVWQVIGEAAHYQRLVLAAAERDATHPGVVERAAQMYRDHQDLPGLSHLYERVVAETRQALTQETDPEEAEPLRTLLSQVHEQLAYLYADGALQDVEAAARHWMGLLEVEPQHVMAVYHARELFKAQGRWHEALPLFDRELALIDDPERRLALLQDEAEVRRQAGDLRGATEALRNACELRPDDPGALYAFATSITARVEAGQTVGAAERSEASLALVGLAERYDAEPALMYATTALSVEPGNDRALQLADHHAHTLGRQGELVDAYRNYLGANAGGYMAETAGQRLSALGLLTPEAGAPAPPSPAPPAPAAPPAVDPVAAPSSSGAAPSSPAASASPSVAPSLEPPPPGPGPAASDARGGAGVPATSGASPPGDAVPPAEPSEPLPLASPRPVSGAPSPEDAQAAPPAAAPTAAAPPAAAPPAAAPPAAAPPAAAPPAAAPPAAAPPAAAAAPAAPPAAAPPAA
ncbi:MAG: hypothetical protein AAGN82_12485, partial [Myxococcota bacterium]